MTLFFRINAFFARHRAASKTPAYARGYESKGDEANPYPAESKQHQDWNDGRRDAYADRESRAW